MLNNLNLYGFASGVAANNTDCGLGPLYLYYHPEIFKDLPFTTEWKDLLMATSDHKGLEVLEELLEISTLLAEDTSTAVKNHEHFCVLAGDHSSAIGTWSGVSHALQGADNLGLLWVDAHMDTHTPKTSPTQNIHGMPIAHLLGYGIPELYSILNKNPKIRPENLCLVGMRSFEEGEAELLKNLKVKIFMMDEIARRGIEVVMHEAIEYLQKRTPKFGMTIDLDAFDPNDAPGVGCREPGGIDATQFLQTVRGISQNPKFIGLEITEYNPLLDIKAKTAYLIRDIIKAIFAT